MMRDATGIIPNSTVAFLNETVENGTEATAIVSELIEAVASNNTIQYLYGSHNSFQVS